MEKFLDKNQLQRVLEDVKGHLDKKQETLTGQTGQVVGFGADGKAVPQEPPVPPDAVTTPDGAEINMEEALGPGPHTIEFTDDGKSAVQASQVSYDAAESGLEAATVQAALDTLSVSASRVSNPNLLDNWYFADPINQRGQTEYTGAGYTIDRWFCGTSGLTVENDCVVINGANANPGANFIQQNLELSYILGKTVTLSFLTKEVFITVTGIFPNKGDNEVKALWNGWGCTLRYRAIDTYPSVLIRKDNTVDTIHPIAAKLELGPVQTLAHKDVSGNWVLNDPPPNKALELAKCQRYQVVVHGASIGVGHKFGSNVLATMNLPVPLRGWPVILYTGAKTSFYRDSIYHTISNITLNTGNFAGQTTDILLNIELADTEFNDVGDVFISDDDYLTLDANL